MRTDIKKICDTILRFKDLSLLVIGDLILDEYVYGDVERISPEAPVQVVDVKENSFSIGGAGNVANNILSLGAKVYVAGVLGDDKDGRFFRRILDEKGIIGEGIILDSSRPTTKKIRIIANGQHVVRLDYESRTKISSKIEKRLIDYALSLSDINGIIISDYAKGVVTKNIVKSIVDHYKKKIPILVDPKGKKFKKYKGVTAITPNKKEAINASGKSDILSSAKKFLNELDLDVVFITLGKDGIFFLEKNGESSHIPAFSKEVYDVSGAGDTVISVLSLSISSGLSFFDSAFLANFAAGIVVSKVGTMPIRKDELINGLISETFTRSKLLDISELSQRVSYLRSQGKRIVFTNGCFDIIHPGHIHLLKRSKELGDILIVAIDDDDSVRRLKGNGRPIFNQFERAKLISSLDCVDFVTIFSHEELRSIIEKIKPDILTKGKDYSLNQVVGRDIVESYGGKVVLIPLLNNGSSSEIIRKIKAS